MHLYQDKLLEVVVINVQEVLQPVRKRVAIFVFDNGLAVYAVNDRIADRYSMLRRIDAIDRPAEGDRALNSWFYIGIGIQ